MKDQRSLGAVAQLEIAALKRVVQASVVKRRRSLPAHSQGQRHAGSGLYDVEGRAFLIHGGAIFFKLEALQPGALSGEDRDVIVRFHRNLLGRAARSDCNRSRWTRHGRRNRLGRARRRRLLPDFLRHRPRSRRPAVVPCHQHLVDDQYHNRQCYAENRSLVHEKITGPDRIRQDATDGSGQGARARERCP